MLEQRTNASEEISKHSKLIETPPTEHRDSSALLILELVGIAVADFPHRWRAPVAVHGCVHHQNSGPSVREPAEVFIVWGHVERLIEVVG